MTTARTLDYIGFIEQAMVMDTQHYLEECLRRSTRVTGLIAKLSELKIKAAKHDESFEETVQEALKPRLYDRYNHRE